ncbi:MAG: helix-turn-helix transcriptional regulator [Rhabdaerophilum sp.]
MNTALPIGERVRLWRTEAKMSGAALAEALGISRGKVSELESGSFSPGVKVALAIETLSGGQIDAADLNDDVRASRHALRSMQSEVQNHVG